MVPNMPVPMVVIPMVVISMSSLVKKERKITLVTCFTRGELHLSSVCMFLQFCEALKQLARAAFVQNVEFSHIFKRDS